MDRAQFVRIADGLAITCAIALPWSTSAVTVIVPLWLIALIPTIDVAKLRCSLTTPAGSFPILFCLVAAVGMLWSDAPWAERARDVVPFLRLLVIPLLLMQFSTGKKGKWIIEGYFLSCLTLLAVSYLQVGLASSALWVFKLHPGGSFAPGIPVKDYIAQSGEFELCAAGIGYVALDAWRAGQRTRALALAVLAIAFVANMAFVATGRTALVVAPVLLIVFAWREFSGRGAAAVVIGGVAIAGILWASSPYLRGRIGQTIPDTERYLSSGDSATPSGIRLEMWRTSILLIEQAPLLGHGTGTIGDLFKKTEASGESSLSTYNPHQQVLTIAIQLGLVGVVVLLSLWVAHFVLFNVPGFVAWCGTALVVQVIVASQFNSYLFDFTSAWTYIWGVGALGGTILQARDSAKVDSFAPSPPQHSAARTR
jgi:O-antigen ligase